MSGWLGERRCLIEFNHNTLIINITGEFSLVKAGKTRKAFLHSSLKTNGVSTVRLRLVLQTKLGIRGCRYVS